MDKRIWTEHREGRCDYSLHVVLAVLLSAMFVLPANAGYREQAKQMHDRLAGVPPTNIVLQQMEDAINPALPGNVNTAADIAMDNENFYNVTL